MSNTEREALTQSIASVLNEHSRESRSNTPDFMLAEFMVSCLEAFEAASTAREKWYGVALSIYGPTTLTPETDA